MSEIITADTFDRGLDAFGKRPAWMEHKPDHTGHWTVIDRQQFEVTTKFDLYRFWDSIPEAKQMEEMKA